MVELLDTANHVRRSAPPPIRLQVSRWDHALSDQMQTKNKIWFYGRRNHGRRRVSDPHSVECGLRGDRRGLSGAKPRHRRGEAKASGLGWRTWCVSGCGLLAWDADGREMRCKWASGYTSGREIWGRGLRDVYTWPMTQIAVGAALDRNCDQVQPAVSAKTERAQ
ncbi:hypothetical protein TIFTF001_027775 [Ficus carica]|uniref:Uncharacterized protein n=1 Tax=Ficus carica TaxID=3494 RepID=A0AA88DNK2_FICCA|nr:hypothetical protein TIFTF001_027775 [Ficus carica]